MYEQLKALAGANAGGWRARIPIMVMLLLYVIPIRTVLSKGYAGIVLLIGFVLYLAWRWWQNESQPVVDFICTAAVIILLYGVVGERAQLFAPVEGHNFFSLFLTLLTTYTHMFSGVVLLLLGGSIGQALAGASRRMGTVLMRVSPAILFGLVIVGSLGKALWNIGQITDHATWITVVAASAAAAGWT